MTVDFNSKVSQLLEEIDNLKQQIIVDKTRVPYLNERLHALYVKLYGKMTEQEILIQKEYKKRIAKINLGKFKPTQNPYGEIVKVFHINHKEYKLYRCLLEKRELHLNKVLERIGLTAREYVKQRNVH